MSEYEFDAVRYCQENMDRMGVMPTGQAVGALIIGEVNALRARVARLEDALKEISTLYWVDAPSPEEMRRIARRALEEK